MIFQASNILIKVQMNTITLQRAAQSPCLIAKILPKMSPHHRKNTNTLYLEGACLTKEVVYQATVRSNNRTETYVGTTEFKTRWRNHQVSFINEKRKSDTEQSKHLWQLKRKQENFTIKWKILAKAKAYTNIKKRCNLCLTEKLFIITKPHLATLNKRNELVSTCRHKRKYILKFS